MRAIIYTALIFLILFILTMFTENAHSEELSVQIERAVQVSAKRHNLDPLLILAIIEVESNFNPNAVGTHGEQGLMQLIPKYHHVGRDIEANIEAGAKYLSAVRRICRPRYGNAWIVCYNAGPYCNIQHPFEFYYFKKVYLAYDRRRTSQQLAGM